MLRDSGLEVGFQNRRQPVQPLGSAFYIAYLVAVLPQSFLMQRFPVGRVLSINLLLFGAFLMCHAACSSFAPLLILRLGLGVAESSVTAGFLIVTSQFYLIEESATRVSYWFLYNGTAMIFSALTSFGVQHANLGSWKPWRLFVLVLGGVTLLLALCFFIWFPGVLGGYGHGHERDVSVVRQIQIHSCWVCVGVLFVALDDDLRKRQGSRPPAARGPAPAPCWCSS